ncbi:hypothetical protein NOVO_00530 [Rickettsiales bacterium Ac37b]|nr:hypothetical protein NOVO_00530 [Rickettsiales bacterium Ac37b]
MARIGTLTKAIRDSIQLLPVHLDTLETEQILKQIPSPHIDYTNSEKNISLTSSLRLELQATNSSKAISDDICNINDLEYLSSSYIVQDNIEQEAPYLYEENINLNFSDIYLMFPTYSNKYTISSLYEEKKNNAHLTNQDFIMMNQKNEEILLPHNISLADSFSDNKLSIYNDVEYHFDDCKWIYADTFESIINFITPTFFGIIQ